MSRQIQYLDGPRLQRCLSAGLDNLVNQRDYLNQINVFPVPDGDTGNNLAHTAVAARRALDEGRGGTADTLLAQLADAALDNAQGNSGALLAQFLQGLAAHTRSMERLTTDLLANALLAAAAGTREALETPREGTILSAIDAAARAADEQRTSNDFAIVLPAMVDATRAAVVASTEQLDELRKAQVVDAGAAGFAAILAGCYEFVLTGSIRDLPATIAPVEFADSHHHQAGELKFRYCTECLLSGQELDQTAIRDAVQGHGDSLVIAGSETRVRIHIHTDDPEQIFALAAGYGTLLQSKADDMAGQARALNRGNHDVAIVTDSAADLPDSLFAELDIHVIPLRVNFGATSHLDKIGITAAEFRAELASNHATPGTSQPTPGDIRRMFDFLATHYESVTSISLSSCLSGTYQATKSTAAAASNAERIRFHDCRNISVGQGLIVKHAADLAAAGLRGKELFNAIEADIATVQTFALVTDLRSAVRSGRLRPIIRHIAVWLRLTPILTNTAAGKIGLYGFLPGRFRLIERFAAAISRKVKSAADWDIAIACDGSDSQSAEMLEGQLREQLGHMTGALHTDIGPALGVHAGMDALVVAIRPRDKLISTTSEPR